FMDIQRRARRPGDFRISSASDLGGGARDRFYDRGFRSRYARSHAIGGGGISKLYAGEHRGTRRRGGDQAATGDATFDRVARAEAERPGGRSGTFASGNREADAARR